MATVGKPCGRPSCEHGAGLHDEEGCTFCPCGYFLQTDLMTEVRLLDGWRRVQGFNRDKAILYGWLRVFEGYSDERANALVNDRNPHKPRESRRVRRDRLMQEVFNG